MFVHSGSLMSASHSCSFFTTYARSNTQTDMQTLLICCLPVLKGDKHVVILQVKDKGECMFLTRTGSKCARDIPCKCEHTLVYIATCMFNSK